MSKYIMAYDVGTTGIKTCIFEIDKDFRILASATESYKLYVYDDGGAEQDPDEWWAAMCSTTRVVLENPAFPPTKSQAFLSARRHRGLSLSTKTASQSAEPFLIWISARERKSRKAFPMGFKSQAQIFSNLYPRL